MCRFVPFVPWTGRSAPRRGLPPSSEPSSPRFEAGARFSIGPAAVGARRRAGSDRRGRSIGWVCARLAGIYTSTC